MSRRNRADLEEEEAISMNRTPERPRNTGSSPTRPGGYGAGTNKAVDEGNWDDRSDLAEVYIQWGGYAIPREAASRRPRILRAPALPVDATVKIEDTMEQDEFDSSDWYAFHGGFISAVSEISGEEPASYVGDSSDPDNVDVYTNEEKVRKAMRSRVLNPDWLRVHGGTRLVGGAGDLSTTGRRDAGLGRDHRRRLDTLWEEVAEKFAFDEDRQGLDA